MAHTFIRTSICYQCYKCYQKLSAWMIKKLFLNISFLLCFLSISYRVSLPQCWTNRNYLHAYYEIYSIFLLLKWCAGIAVVKVNTTGIFFPNVLFNWMVIILITNFFATFQFFARAYYTLWFWQTNHILGWRSKSSSVLCKKVARCCYTYSHWRWPKQVETCWAHCSIK